MTKVEQINIAKCLVRAIETKEAVNKETQKFLSNWIYDADYKRHSEWLDVWTLVLDNYIPKKTPVLYRATDYINDGKIESYTGSIRAAELFLVGCGENGKLIVCDTAPYITVNFPLVDLLRNELELENSHFNKRILEQYIGEDEYIMRTNKVYMSIYKQVA